MLKIWLKNVHLKIGSNWVNLEQKIILCCGCSLYAPTAYLLQLSSKVSLNNKAIKIPRQDWNFGTLHYCAEVLPRIYFLVDLCIASAVAKREYANKRTE